MDVSWFSDEKDAGDSEHKSVSTRKGAPEQDLVQPPDDEDYELTREGTPLGDLPSPHDVSDYQPLDIQETPETFEQLCTKLRNGFDKLMELNPTTRLDDRTETDIQTAVRLNFKATGKRLPVRDIVSVSLNSISNEYYNKKEGESASSQVERNFAHNLYNKLNNTIKRTYEALERANTTSQPS
jgi:hypothetical protein